MSTNEEHQIKRRLSRLSSRTYGDIRALCRAEGLTQARLEHLIQSVVVDRIQLALSLYACARKLDAQPHKHDGDYRSMISRGYYCHYHLARAAVFWMTRDDVDQHETLPKRLGKVWPTEHIEFIERLERYRGIRNEVEYSPYPEIDEPLSETAAQVLRETELSVELLVRWFYEKGVEVDTTTWL